MFAARRQIVHRLQYPVYLLRCVVMHWAHTHHAAVLRQPKPFHHFHRIVIAVSYEYVLRTQLLCHQRRRKPIQCE